MVESRSDHPRLSFPPRIGRWKEECLKRSQNNVPGLNDDAHVLKCITRTKSPKIFISDRLALSLFFHRRECVWTFSTSGRSSLLGRHVDKNTPPPRSISHRCCFSTFGAPEKRNEGTNNKLQNRPEGCEPLSRSLARLLSQPVIFSWLNNQINIGGLFRFSWQGESSSDCLLLCVRCDVAWTPLFFGSLCQTVLLPPSVNGCLCGRWWLCTMLSLCATHAFHMCSNHTFCYLVVATKHPEANTHLLRKQTQSDFFCKRTVCPCQC